MGKKRETLYSFRLTMVLKIEYQPAHPLSTGKTAATVSTSAKSELIRIEEKSAVRNMVQAGKNSFVQHAAMP